MPHDENKLPTDTEGQSPTDAEERLTTDAEERLPTDSEEQSPTDDEADSRSIEERKERNKQFLQAASYSVEWETPTDDEDDEDDSRSVEEHNKQLLQAASYSVGRETPTDENDSHLVEERNKRFIQAVSYFIEWAKHIITIGSALMLLSVALLKDIVREAQAPASYVIAGLLVLSYLSMLVAIWLALRLVRFAASSMLTMAPQIVTVHKLNGLQSRLDRVQILFLVSLTFFSGLALCALLTWAFRATGPVSH